MDTPGALDFYVVAYKWGLTPRELAEKATGLEYVLMRAALARILKLEAGDGT